MASSRDQDWLFANESVVCFLDALASKRIMPAGASAAAFVGAQAAAMLRASCLRRIGNELRVEAELKHASERADLLRGELLALVDLDVSAFNALSAAFRLPKSSDLDRKRRKEWIRSAGLAAAAVPERIAVLAHELADLIESVRITVARDESEQLEMAEALAEGCRRAALLTVEANRSLLPSKPL